MPKILVLGDKGVGKSTFIRKVADRKENGVYKKVYKISGDDRIIEFDFIENNTELASKAACIIYMIDASRPSSFNVVREM